MVFQRVLSLLLSYMEFQKGVRGCAMMCVTMRSQDESQKLAFRAFIF